MSDCGGALAKLVLRKMHTKTSLMKLKFFARKAVHDSYHCWKFELKISSDSGDMHFSAIEPRWGGCPPLIWFIFSMWRTRLGRIWSFVLGFRSLVARLVPFERGGTKWAKKILAMESVNSLRISAPQWWLLREGRDGKCEGRNEKCEFLARESVSSSPIVRIFGKGKCKFIANFSATMVTSLPSLSLSVCISLSLSLSLSLTESTSRTI